MLFTFQRAWRAFSKEEYLHKEVCPWMKILQGFKKTHVRILWYGIKLRMFSRAYQRGTEASGRHQTVWLMGWGLVVFVEIAMNSSKIQERVLYEASLTPSDGRSVLVQTFLNDFFSSTMLNLKFTCLNFCLLPLVSGFCTTNTILYSPVYPWA